jgi:AraC-type DNA-binding domain-containing proteins
MAELTRIVCERRTYTPRIYTHRHPYAQLVIPVDGPLNITVGRQRTADCQETSIVFLPPDADHSFSSSPEDEFLVFDIPRNFVGRAAGTAGECAQILPVDARWQALRTLLSSEVADRPADSQAIAALFSYSLHLLATKNVPPSLVYIHRNYHKKIVVKELAGIEHYNTTYYYEWFMARTGTTPRLYIQMLRINKAKELLRHTDFDILQIAQQVGYTYQASLTKAFHEIVGISPAGFRGQTRK